MNNTRELMIGFLAALVSIAILAGSFALSFVENEAGIAQGPLIEPSQTITSTSTMPIPTPLPGKPTLKLSATSTVTFPSPTPSCQFPEDWQAVIVQQGDDLESLAEAYQTSAEALMEANCLLIVNLMPGSLLYVPELQSSPTFNITTSPTETMVMCTAPPVGWILYTIKSGDTLYSIASAYGITVSQLQAGNCMDSSTIIVAGEILWVPNVPTITSLPSITPTPSPTKTPSNTPTPTTRPHRPPRLRPTRTPRIGAISTSLLDSLL